MPTELRGHYAMDVVTSSARRLLFPTRFASLFAHIFTTAASHALAEYPEPIRIVVPFAANGGPGVMARMFAQRLSDCSIVWRR